MDLAVENIVTSRLANNGQACTNAERVYVHEDIADTFVDKLKESFESKTIDNPRENRNADVGPLISHDRLKTVEDMVNKAKENGAKVVAGGEPADLEKGYFYKPTVLTNVDHDSTIMQEEIFGPVIPIATFKTLDEAIDKGNDTVYGLSSSVYTDDMNEAMRVVNELKFGETYVNHENFEAVQGYHAGIRKSGLGGTDGKHGLEDFLVTQVVYMQYNNNKQ